jgi:transposase
LTTKIHATCDAIGNPTGFHLTAGQEHDLAGADALMDQPTQAKHALADKAYDADRRVREKLKDKGCVAVIPPKKNRLDPSEYDKDLYKSPHLIENFFAKLKQYRAIATRYGKTSQSFLGAVYMAASVIWLN